MFSDISNYLLRAVNQLLAFFYSLPVVGGSYGLAIILLTVAVMVALMPLTLKATRSTIKMTQMQPKLRELQKKHADDKATLNQEMMALYQSEGINPVGGCLPMLAQMPVFLILFNVLRGLARRESEKPYFAAANKAHEWAGFPVIDGQTFDPANLDHDSQLYQDLSNDTSMDFLGVFDLGRSASDVISESIPNSIPYLILILFVIGSSFYQQKQIQARRSDVAQDLTQQQRTQQQLLKILPLMSGIWSFAFPAGLVLYWATSNLFRIGQQSYITRSLYSGDAPGAQLVRQQVEDADKSKLDASDSATSTDAADAITTSDKPSTNGSSNGSEKAGRKGKKSASNKTPKTAEDDRPDVQSGGSRAAEWQRLRAERARSQPDTKTRTVESSSRVTPKGTKPTTKKKKKR